MADFESITPNRILIAEDEEYNFYLMEEFLNGLNLEIIYAKDGVEAVKAVEDYPNISLILMDIKMPNMDGYEAMKQIKYINSKIPVIAVTAFAQLYDKKKSLEMGFDDFVSKPVSRDKLIKILKTYLK